MLCRVCVFVSNHLTTKKSIVVFFAAKFYLVKYYVLSTEEPQIYYKSYFDKNIVTKITTINSTCSEKI